MSTLDEIAARDAKWPDLGYYAVTNDEDGMAFMVDDRRYLLGLVREAREALLACRFSLKGARGLASDNDDTDADIEYATRLDEIADLLVRLTEGSDRT